MNTQENYKPKIFFLVSTKKKDIRKNVINLTSYLKLIYLIKQLKPGHCHEHCATETVGMSPE